MPSKPPTQKTSVVHSAVAIALEKIDPKLWDEAVQSQRLSELAVIRPVLDPDANREAFYKMAARADILIVLYSRGLLLIKRFQTALANSIPIDRPAVLFVRAVKDVASGGLEIINNRFFETGLRDVRKGLEEVVSGLNAGSVTRLAVFAPQLEEVIMRADVWRKEPEQTQSATGSEPSTASQAETAAEDEGAVSASVFDESRLSDFSQLARQILQVARRLGEGRQRPQASARRLISSMVLSGLRRKGDGRTGSWLVSLIEQDRDAVRARIINRYPAAARYKASFDAILRSDLTMSDTMTESLQAILDTARLLATEARPGMPVLIGARHLLGAAVRQDEHATSVQRALKDFGLHVDDVRQQLIDTLPSWGLDDDLEAWRRVLEPVLVDVERRLPTYAADSAIGPDLIGITREVEAMASLVSAWSVEPPLSIGLFGEWGSGKSFFMQKMKERVRKIAIAARESKQAQRDFGYYRNIVQVEFNAWHYVEGNLWASLVEHIFTNLRFEGTNEENLDSEENIIARREKMLSLLRDRTADANAKDEQAKDLQKTADEAQQNADEADSLAADAKAKADQAELESTTAMHKAEQMQASAQDSSEIRRSMLSRDIVEEVRLSPEVRNQLEAALTQLGITKERLQTIQGVRDALEEATETTTIIREGMTLVREKGGWMLLLWAVGVPLLVVAGLEFLFYWLTSGSNASWVHQIENVASVLAGLMASIVASWKKVSALLQPLLKTIEKMKVKRVELQERVEKERQRRATRAAELEQDVIQKRSEAEAQRRIAAAKAAEALQARQEAENRRAEAEKAAKLAAEARAGAEALSKEAEALRPERRIATFIQDRAAATDYRRHLGVPALIRRDFEKLSAMFETQREAEEKGEDCGKANQQNDPTVVNRIILYIDDLDRCPPQKVVDVLRAVHLLLAFRLFVVVVAVDARWMKRSLKDRFSLMLTTAEARSAAGGRKGSADGAPLENIAWRATASPDDYLEKIFQVPFWIRPLGASGSRRLVTELTRHDVESEAAPNAVGSQANVGDGNRTPVDEKQIDFEKKADTSAQGTGSVRETIDSVQDASAVSGQTPDTITPKSVLEESPIEAKPRTLMLTPHERDYMLELAPVIGRSPRSVKRFLNCYRLLKSTLDPVELDRAKRSGTFRTSMLLLGIVTGFPEAAPALLADLRDARRTQAPEAWARAAAKRLQLEDRGKWATVLPVISRLRQSGVHTIAPLVDAALLVDRFSFSPVQRPVEELV